MNQKSIVRLSNEERAVCEATVQKETGKPQKLRRATILLKADIEGPAWDDAKISEAVGGRTRTVENVRQAFVLEGLEEALARKNRATPPTLDSRYAGVDRITLVCDNWNTHTKGAFYEAFPPDQNPRVHAH